MPLTLARPQQDGHAVPAKLATCPGPRHRSARSRPGGPHRSCAPGSADRFGLGGLGGHVFLPVNGRALLGQLAGGHYMDAGEPVVLLGDSGTGKSHLLIGLRLAACEQGRRVRYVTTAQLIKGLIGMDDPVHLPPYKEPDRCGRADRIVGPVLVRPLQLDFLAGPGSSAHLIVRLGHPASCQWSWRLRGRPYAYFER
jgi:hypothetical protein